MQTITNENRTISTRIIGLNYCRTCISDVNAVLQPWGVVEVCIKVIAYQLKQIVNSQYLEMNSHIPATIFLEKVWALLLNGSDKSI